LAPVTFMTQVYSDERLGWGVATVGICLREMVYLYWRALVTRSDVIFRKNCWQIPMTSLVMTSGTAVADGRIPRLVHITAISRRWVGGHVGPISASISCHPRSILYFHASISIWCNESFRQTWRADFTSMAADRCAGTRNSV